ncbi:MAG: phosphoribosylglycinamide formyltransferase [Anaerolineales bacterium]|nr:phosphoribosylglycinamide formyltransferase [Anaerolineales bacterium]
MDKRLNLGFFASHRGSNMQAVLDACGAGDLAARPCLVISNNSESEALARAEREGIPALHLSSRTHPDPVQLDKAILSALRRQQVDLCVLAGYMKKLGAKTLSAYQGRVINIHPALLPKYGGEGMYGAHVHAAVIAAGDSETGVTIHLVDEEYDHGRILAQCRLPVLATDTAVTLAARVLAREHTFLVETLARIVRGEIVLPGE